MSGDPCAFSTAKCVRAGARIWLDEMGRHKCMERASVMCGAELDWKTTEPVAGLARFGGHILGTRVEIRPDVAAGRMQVRRRTSRLHGHCRPVPLRADLGDWKGGRDDARVGSE